MSESSSLEAGLRLFAGGLGVQIHKSRVQNVVKAFGYAYVRSRFLFTCIFGFVFCAGVGFSCLIVGTFT